MGESFIREIRAGDLSMVSQLHMAAFPKSALGQLGGDAVKRYYHWLLKGPHEVVSLGLFRDPGLVGFCFGGIFRGALSGFLRKNRFFLILRVLTHPWLIGTPIIRDRLTLASRFLFHRPVSTASWVSPQKSFGILAIAVDPRLQSTGYGSRLMAETERIASDRGFNSLHLTVAEDNRQAIKFYEKLGWQKSLGSDTVWHGVMTKQISSSQKNSLRNL